MLKPGDSIPAMIEEGLEHSRVLPLAHRMGEGARRAGEGCCMSANAFGSDWAQLLTVPQPSTLNYQPTGDPLNQERRFIPLRLDDAPIKGSLAQFLYINWRPADREQGYAKLLEACLPPTKQPAAKLRPVGKVRAIAITPPMQPSALPCGHHVLDPSGTFCLTCFQEGRPSPTINIQISLEFVTDETSKEGGPFHNDALQEGFIEPAVTEVLLARNVRAQSRREFLRDCLTTAACIASIWNVKINRRYERERDRQNVSEWKEIIRTLDSAIEGPDKLKRLSELQTAFRNAGFLTAANLCAAAEDHLSGRPRDAQYHYQSLRDDEETWNGLPQIAKRHTLVRLGKVSGNLGDHHLAANAFQTVLQERLSSDVRQELETIRETLNSIYQTLPLMVILQRLGNGPEQARLQEMEHLLARASECLRVRDVRDASESHGGLREGIAMFHEILIYLRTRKEEHLRTHLELIKGMIGAQRETTGWNRYSQFIALALAGNSLDYAREGLFEAVSWLMNRSVKDAEVTVIVAGLAYNRLQPESLRDPGAVEMAVHLAMWGQYGWARRKDHKSLTASLDFGATFLAARNLLANANHQRFIRDLDRFLFFDGQDAVRQITGIPAEVRSYGPRKYPTSAFFPLD